MRFAKFFSSFFYVGFNCNFRIVATLTLEEVKGEKKYGIQSTGYDELKTLEEQGLDISHASMYMPASYKLMEDLFSRMDTHSIKHFLDLGCGKGRALSVAAHSGIMKITG